MHTFVRIGGLRDAASVALVPENGAAGFVVDSPGAPRNLPEEAVAPLLERLPHGAEAWAQVRDPDAATIRRLFDEVGVDRIEVHGAVPEGLEFLEIHHLVPALPVPGPGTGGAPPKVPPAEDFPMLALETEGSGLEEGHARGSDWAICGAVVEAHPGRKILLSGGVTAANAADALALVRPWGVGVGAGVETRPGAVDPARLRELLAALEAAERAAGA